MARRKNTKSLGKARLGQVGTRSSHEKTQGCLWSLSLRFNPVRSWLKKQRAGDAQRGTRGTRSRVSPPQKAEHPSVPGPLLHDEKFVQREAGEIGIYWRGPGGGESSAIRKAALTEEALRDYKGFDSCRG